MKETDARKQKKKAIPHCFQKRSTNSSLSQLLSLGAYKKRIKNLTRNNRLLAVELNNLKLRHALLDNQLKGSVRKNHQIMYARIKLKEMASAIAKLVADMAEVISYLEGDWDTDDLLEKVRHEKLQIKSPAVSCIEESSVSESPNRNNTEISRELNDISTESPDMLDAIQISSELPPVLFIEDSEDKDKLNSSSSGSNAHSEICDIPDQVSVTPVLDIDMAAFNRRKRSSHRNTQIFVFPEVRKTRSRGKTTSAGSDHASTTSDTYTFNLPSSPVSETPPPENENIRTPVEAIEIPMDIAAENVTCKKPDTVALNLCHNQSKNDHTDLCKISDANSLKIFHANVETHAVPNNQPTDSNHTVLLCEDMELTDVVRPLNPITFTFNNSEFKSNPLEKNDKDETNSPSSTNDNFEKEFNPLQSNNGSNVLSLVPSQQHSEKNNSDKHEPILNDPLSLPSNNSNCVQKTMPFCEENVNKDPKEYEDLLNHTLSPFPIKIVRHQKPIDYKHYFSPKSDEDCIAVEKPKRKRTSKRKSISAAESLETASNVLKDCLYIKKTSSEDGNKVKKDVSVYDLDVSDSKMKKSHKSKSHKNKKTDQKKNATKFLLSNCKVTKLQSGHLKFSKDETDKMKKSNDLLNTISNLEVSETGGTLNAEKKNQSNLQLNKNVRKSILSTNKFADNQCDISNNKQQGTPKRVSFAATDIVCNYKKMSMSKVISENEKVMCMSKGVDESESYLKDTELDTANEMTCDAAGLLNSSDETELYAWPLNAFAVNEKNDIRLDANTNNNNKCVYSKSSVNKYLSTKLEDEIFKSNEITVRIPEKSENEIESHLKTSDTFNKNAFNKTELLNSTESSKYEQNDIKEIYLAEKSRNKDAKTPENKISSCTTKPDDKMKKTSTLNSFSGNNLISKTKVVKEKNFSPIIFSSSDDSWFGTLPTYVAPETGNFHLSSDSTISSITKQKLQSSDKEDLIFKSKNLISKSSNKLGKKSENKNEHSLQSSGTLNKNTVNNEELLNITENSKYKHDDIKDIYFAEKGKNEEGKISENKKSSCKVKLANEMKNTSKLNSISDNKTIPATEIISHNFSSSSEEFEIPQFNCVAAETGNLHLSSESTISSTSKQKRQSNNKENLVCKSQQIITKSPSKLGKLSLKINKISQKDKTVGKKNSEPVVSNAVQDEFSRKHLINNMNKNEIPSDHNQENNFGGEVKKSNNQELLAEESKYSLETAHRKDKISTKLSSHKKKTKLDHLKTPNTSPRAESGFQPSPVLRDVNNLEENSRTDLELKNLPKRRSRTVVNYREPSLMKKMRRE